MHLDIYYLQIFSSEILFHQMFSNILCLKLTSFECRRNLQFEPVFRASFCYIQLADIFFCLFGFPSGCHAFHISSSLSCFFEFPSACHAFVGFPSACHGFSDPPLRVMVSRIPSACHVFSDFPLPVMCLSDVPLPRTKH